MTVTIGSFSTNRLTGQPFGYEGDARTGLTARTFRIGGLLTPAEWQTLVSEYNSWRSTRIQDQDTLLSGVVGATIALTITNTNNLSVTGLACWFTEPPAGEQAGAYISATVTLVDAAQALAVLLREQTRANEKAIADAQNVDCAVITANLNKRKAETDCEIAALSAGLAGDFAQQELDKQEIETTAKAATYNANSATLEAIKSAEAAAELADKTAQLAGQSASAADTAAVDLALEAQQAYAKGIAYTSNAADLETIEAANIAIEQAQAAARVSALSTGATLDDLRSSRALLAIYEKYISEDLPDIGTITLGGVTIKLVKPMATYSDGPSVSLTATGASYITGPLAAHETRQIEGVITSGSYSDLLSWYSSTISSVPGAGTWFPTIAPTATAEKFLISGAVGTRYTVTLEVKKIL